MARMIPPLYNGALDIIHASKRVLTLRAGYNADLLGFAHVKMSSSGEARERIRSK